MCYNSIKVMVMKSHFLYNIRSRFLSCCYDFDTGEYSFDSKYMVAQDNGVDRCWLNKMKMLYRRNVYNIYSIDFGTYKLFGENCKICIVFDDSSGVVDFGLQIFWFSKIGNKFTNDFSDISVRGWSSEYDCYVTHIDLDKSEIVKAFVENHDFCFRFCELYFETALKEYRDECK